MLLNMLCPTAEKQKYHGKLRNEATLMHVYGAADTVSSSSGNQHWRKTWNMIKDGYTISKTNCMKSPSSFKSYSSCTRS